MPGHVLPIEKLDVTFLDQAGSKSVRLGELASAGFFVPGGFCVLSSGYREFVASNALEEKIRECARTASSSEKPATSNVQVRIRELFRSAAFPEQLREEILPAYRALGTHLATPPAVAVRSSGAAEDGASASFAGQFDSFLNVSGEEQLLEHIKICWAGFWKTASLAYRTDRCRGHQDQGIAVLVQKMVPAQLSGVLFSANPLSGSEQEMVIEASWGLGEAVVDGTVTPDRFVVDSETNRLIEQSVQVKRLMVALGGDKGIRTHREHVPKDKQTVACLNEKQIRFLVDMGKKVQQHFGYPQDIEWAFDKQHLYLLQARPITTLPCQCKQSSQPEGATKPGARSEFDTDTQPDTEWTSSTIADMLPGTLSPLTISQMKALEYGFQKPQRELGLLPSQVAAGKEIRFLGFFYNRAHINMSLIRSLVRQVPLVSPANLERLLEEGTTGGKEKRWASFRFVRDVPNLMRVGKHALEIVRKLEPAADELLTCGLRQYEEEALRKESHCPDNSTLLEKLDTIQEKQAEIYAAHITASQFGEVTFQLLKRFIRRLTHDDCGILTSQLISGSSTPLFARPIAELWGLAQQVGGSKRLRQFFASDSAQTVWRQLHADESRPTLRFREAIQVFMSQYGYRSRYGAELMRPSWDEEPIFILSMVKIYSGLLLTLNPWEMEREQAQRRLGILRGLEAKLKPLSRRVLKELLNLMHTLIPMRQNMRALSLMQARLARRVVQRLEGRLLRAGALSRQGDIYFLSMDELYALGGRSPAKADCPSGQAVEITERVARRKLDFQRNLQVVLPASFRGQPRPTTAGAVPPEARRAKRFRGIPASPGRVTGQARKVTVPLQEIRVRPGEILILPGMDAGWTPLFLAAAAIVTERGGILSHGSILAREYGIPAVTSVADATRFIETGQVITVDGDRGDIWL